MQKILWRMALCALVISFITSRACAAQSRNQFSLNGTWDIADSKDGTALPSSYAHTAPVPGLAHSATPAFAQVDEYSSAEVLVNLVGQGRMSKSDFENLGKVRGVSHQDRDYFWYRKSFEAPSKRDVALIRIAKAQFGISVYLNGVKIGEHFPCFSSATFDATKAIHWSQKNELVVRVGAHPGMLPKNVSQGTDFEKNRWTPGIYDDVDFIAADNPVITAVQVAPDIAHSRITIQTELKNFSSMPVSTQVMQAVSERKSSAKAGMPASTFVHLAADETKTITQQISIPHAHLWSTDDPFLYNVTTKTSGDSKLSRFGMREFRFDTTTRLAYLNGKPFFMRGSNITLHRFFEDPDVGTLPWDEPWLHRLLVDIPKKLHWNSFRFCIGPVPDRWLEIADENGLIIQNEYFIWTGPGPQRQFDYDPEEMKVEYTEWMRDNWNHPSVGIWDATNESILPAFTDSIIPAVRGLDLSNRPWENSYNAPAGPDDPVEDHEYLAHRKDFKIDDLETLMGSIPSGTQSKSGHAAILNEYGWLWLNRDGSPTLLTDKLYPKLLGANDNTAARFALQDDLLQGETEFWRAYRHYAGVLHFVYLTASDPHAFTADHFESVKDLKLRPGFEYAMEQAFNPLCVYLNFWQQSVAAGPRLITVAMANDEGRERKGKLVLRLKDASGKTTLSDEKNFDIPPYGAMSYAISMSIPASAGDALIEAVATTEETGGEQVISHRRFHIK